MQNQDLNRLNDTLYLAKKIRAKIYEIEKLKGTNFNIFNILDMRENEVKTHSAFISELLKPNGTHNLGDTFLSLFIDLLNNKTSEVEEWQNIEILTENNYKSTKIEVEKNIGKKTDINGGRLDIIISTSKMQICIENKINASETDNQLTRYKNYLNKFPKNSNILIFLTKFGEKSNFENLQIGIDYVTLSYKKDILIWLEKCFNASADFPIVRETIKQYIVLVKSITNQINASEMKEEIHNIILKNIEGSEIIAQEYDNAIESISDKLKEDIKKTLLNQHIINHEDEIGLKKSQGKYSSIWIKTQNKESIGIESFNGKGHEGGSLFIGLVDFNRTQREEKYKYHWWIDGTIETIWNKKTLFEKLQKYSQGNSETKTEIVNEITEKVREFIQKY